MSWLVVKQQNGSRDQDKVRRTNTPCNPDVAEQPALIAPVDLALPARNHVEPAMQPGQPIIVGLAKIGRDPRTTGRSAGNRALFRVGFYRGPGSGRPAAATRAWNSRGSAPTSGCQRTPMQNGRSGSSMASTEPSGAQATATYPGASSKPWW